jgi:polyvinyl alcohol dehydrogenase (cytochrome)
MHSSRPRLLGLVLWCVIVSAGAQAQSAAPDTQGEGVYREHCATCHEAGVPRAANRTGLASLSAEKVRSALTDGLMRTQAAGLSPAQRDAVVHFLTDGNTSQEAASTAQAACPAGGSFSPSDKQPHWNGWGVDVTQHRFQPAAMAQLSAAQVPKLQLKWAFGFAGGNRSYGQPAVLGGRLFLGNSNKKVYSLSAGSGCTYWTFEAENSVRTAITVAPLGKNWAVYFADQHATAYALDAETGKLLWKTRVSEYDSAMTTGAPTLSGGRLYVPASSPEEVMGASGQYECCKFRGTVAALDAASGKLIWRGTAITAELKPTRKNAAGVQLWGPAGASIWSSPTVDVKRKRIYVTTGDDYTDPPSDASDAFVAFDAGTGQRLWVRQATAGDTYNIGCELPKPYNVNCPAASGPDHDFGSSAILVNLPRGKRALIAGQKSGMVHAIDPDHDGAILWEKRVAEGGKSGGVQWGPAADDENVYVAVSDVAQKQVQPGAPGGQPSLFGVPLQLDPDKGGGLYALKLATGETVWHTPHPGCNGKPSCSPAQSAAVTVIPGVVFSGGLDGHLRAYSAKKGEIIWDVDTVRDFDTVNGVRAKGGSMDGPGAVVVGGMLYVNSGYLYTGTIPGNVLLAFSVDGK